MTVEFKYPRYKYYSDHTDAERDNFFSDIIDHEANVFLSSTGKIDRLSYPIDTIELKDDERHELHKLCKVMSDDHFLYMIEIGNYCMVNLEQRAPQKIHTTIPLDNAPLYSSY
jgi:hypothetical protein